MSLLTAELPLLLLVSSLLYGSERRLHYRDAPYLFPRRWVMRGSLSLVLHNAVLALVWLMLLETDSAVWRAAVVTGSLPMLLAVRYTFQVLRNPRRVVERNKRRWKGSELIP